MSAQTLSSEVPVRPATRRTSRRPLPCTSRPSNSAELPAFTFKWLAPSLATKLNGDTAAQYRQTLRKRMRRIEWSPWGKRCKSEAERPEWRMVSHSIMVYTAHESRTHVGYNVTVLFPGFHRACQGYATPSQTRYLQRSRQTLSVFFRE